MLDLASVSTSSLIGVAIACGGNVLISLALTIQKLAHRRQRESLSASNTSTPSSSSPATRSPRASTDTLTSPHDSDASPQLTAIPIVLLEDISPSSTPPPHPTQLRPDDGPPKDPDVPSTTALVVPTSTKSRLRIQSPSPSNEERRSPSPSPSDGKPGELAVEEGAYLRSKLWWLGLGLIAIGEGGNFLSYGFAPASVVAPLGTVALVANCLFAPLILRERFHLKELLGMGLAILGAVTVVWSSSASNPRLDPNALIVALRQIPFIVYTSLTLAALVLLILLSRSARFGNRFIGIDVGICALFGGYTVLSTKALSSLLSSMFLAAFRYPVTWLLVAVLVGTSVMQIKYLNKALMRFESKTVIPTQFCFFSLAAIVGSAVLYQEFLDVSFSRFVNFSFGIATTFFGVYLLTSYSQAEDENDDPPPSTSDPTAAFSATNPTTTAPARPHYLADRPRATSSASMNLLIPKIGTASSPFSERTPLLIPASSSSITNHVHNLSTTPGSSTVRLLAKRRSTGEFTPTLGLNSQAGFLLLATTPPPAGQSPADRMGRGRSASKGQGSERRGSGIIEEGRSNDDVS